MVADLRSVHVPPAACVGLYVADDGEPDLGPLVDELRGAGHPVALPVPTGAPIDGDMEFRRWHRDDELVPGRYGIPTPPAGDDRHAVPDVVLVPTVRFDPAGNRLGRGAGYYDRWLDRSGERGLLAVGIALAEQQLPVVPTESHDRCLHMAMTERAALDFRA